METSNTYAAAQTGSSAITLLAKDWGGGATLIWPTDPTAPTKPETPLEWLDRRVDEMRVKL